MTSANQFLTVSYSVSYSCL